MPPVIIIVPQVLFPIIGVCINERPASIGEDPLKGLPLDLLPATGGQRDYISTPRFLQVTVRRLGWDHTRRQAA